MGKHPFYRYVVVSPILVPFKSHNTSPNKSWIRYTSILKKIQQPRKKSTKITIGTEKRIRSRMNIADQERPKNILSDITLFRQG